MSTRPVVIFGTGDIGQLAHFYFTRDLGRDIAAFTGDADRLDRSSFCGLPVIPFERILESHPPDGFDMFVALSYSKLNEVRARKYHEAKAKGYRLTNLICSRLVSWGDTVMGDNCFIFENQTIQPFVTIGNNVTLWSGNHIGHDSTIEDHCFITSHVVVSGHVRVGAGSFLGVNATLRNAITIGPETLVAAGSVIMKNTAAKGVYYPERARRLPKSSDEIEL